MKELDEEMVMVKYEAPQPKPKEITVINIYGEITKEKTTKVVRMKEYEEWLLITDNHRYFCQYVDRIILNGVTLSF